MTCVLLVLCCIQIYFLLKNYGWGSEGVYEEGGEENSSWEGDELWFDC